MSINKNILLIVLSAFSFLSSFAQEKKSNRLFDGMYFQWGYNREWYTRSNIHIEMSNGNNFTLHRAKAKDKPDFDAIYKEPLEISIPQYNYRLGFYLNKEKSKAIEINFDHIKYVLPSTSVARVTGTIDGIQVDGDSVLNHARFMHLEHTDGGNLLHINYVQQKTLKKNAAKTRSLITAVYKAGAGINIPRTDFTWRGDRLNNDFHIAGYNFGVEGGIRFYPVKKFFIEGAGKTGYVRYVNALANTTQLKGNRVHHGFGYAEIIATLGFDLGF